MVKINLGYLYANLNFEDITTIIEPYGTSCEISNYIWEKNKDKNYKYILNNHKFQPKYMSFYNNADVALTYFDDMECFNFDLEYLHKYQVDKQNLIILKPLEQYIGNRVHQYLCDNNRNITARVYLCRLNFRGNSFRIGFIENKLYHV